METDNNPNPNPNLKPSGCMRPLKGCAIVVGVAFVGIMILLIYLARMPVVQDIVECRSNMVDLGAALQRYYDVNGVYPAQLADLKKDYLKDPSALRCPLDKSTGNDGGYVYHRPRANSPGSFVMIECDMHRLRKDIPVTKLLLRKDGNVVVDNPAQHK